MAAQLLERAVDAPRGDVRLSQRLRGAQDDQVAEGEEPRLPRPPLGLDEPGVDQALDGAAGEVKQALDVVDAVGMRSGLSGAGYFLATFFGAASSAWARLGALRVSSAAFAGAGAFFLSRLARSASMRSMTSAPPSGASTMVISWPSTFFCTAASTRARTSSV